MTNPCPAFLAESVAEARSRLADWPDWEGRFGGCGATRQLNREVVTTPAQIAADKPLHSQGAAGQDYTVHRRTAGRNGYVAGIGRTPQHVRPGNAYIGRTFGQAECWKCKREFAKPAPNAVVCGLVNCVRAWRTFKRAERAKALALVKVAVDKSKCQHTKWYGHGDYFGRPRERCAECGKVRWTGAR